MHPLQNQALDLSRAQERGMRDQLSLGVSLRWQRRRRRLLAPRRGVPQVRACCGNGPSGAYIGYRRSCLDGRPGDMLARLRNRVGVQAIVLAAMATATFAPAASVFSVAARWGSCRHRAAAITRTSRTTPRPHSCVRSAAARRSSSPSNAAHRKSRPRTAATFHRPSSPARR